MSGMEYVSRVRAIHRDLSIRTVNGKHVVFVSGALFATTDSYAEAEQIRKMVLSHRLSLLNQERSEVEEARNGNSLFEEFMRLSNE